MRSELASIIWTASPRMMIFSLSVLTIALGAWFLQPYPAFTISPGYHYMSTLYPEEVWGWAMVSLGTLKLIVLLLGRRIFTSRRFLVRILPATLNFCIFVFWLFLFWGVLESDSNSSLVVWYGSVMLGTLWCGFRHLNEGLAVPEGTFRPQRRRAVSKEV